MANSEEILEKRFGRQTPFTVPEGYFAQLQQNVMDALPEQPSKVVVMTPRHRFLRPMVGIAASVCIALFGMAVWFGSNSDSDKNVALAESDDFVEMFSDADGAAEYIMMDNEDIYAFVSQN